MSATDVHIPLLQAIQLVALAPCLFTLVFLLLKPGGGRRAAKLVPVLYFLCVAAELALPVLPLLPEPLAGFWGKAGLMLLGSLLPAATFLLVLQSARREPPTASHWLILALPLLGGGPVVYASLISHELCLARWGCFLAEDLENLYAIFATSLIFLLLVVYYARKRQAAKEQRRSDQNRYWLTVALIGLNLLLLGARLGVTAQWITPGETQVVGALLHMTFIYVVMTMLFRVFGAVLPEERRHAPRRAPEEEAERVQKVAGKFTAMMEEEKFYRDIACSREVVARKLGVNDNYLSRVINQHFGKRFTEIVNGYRIRDAKQWLRDAPDEPVTTIAFGVGFNSIPSFNRVFKEETGMSPREYRARGEE